ncbi:hypothetical protein JOM56_015389 [Amanita muscaria]
MLSTASPATFRFGGGIDHSLNQTNALDTSFTGWQMPHMMDTRHQTAYPSRDYSSPEVQELIANAPTHLLAHNMHYMRQIRRLEQFEEEKCGWERERHTLEQNIAALTSRCQTYQEVNQNLTRAQEHLAISGSSSHFRSLASKPPALEHDNYPNIRFWTHKLYTKEKRRIAGETDGLATSKKKPGRKKFNSEGDALTEAATHPYLQNEDGSLVSPEQLGVMSQKARRIWIAFKKTGEAPATWGQISTDLHDYYVREMVSDPRYIFLRYCNDGEWKLLEWTRKSYSSWTLSNGLREKKSKKSSLDDPDLIKMTSNETTPFLPTEEMSPNSNEPPLFFTNPLNVGDDDIREKEPEPVSASTISTFDRSISRSPTPPSPLIHNGPSTTSSEHDHSNDLASRDERAPDEHAPDERAPAQPTPAAITEPASRNTIAAASLSVPPSLTQNPTSNLEGSAQSGEDLCAPGDTNTTQSTVSKKRSSEVLEASGAMSPSQIEATTSTSTTPASTVTITSAVAAKRRKISEDTLAVPSKAFSDRNYCMMEWCANNPGGKLYKFSEHWEALSTDGRKLFKKQADAARKFAKSASKN